MFNFGKTASASVFKPTNSSMNTGTSLQAQKSRSGTLETESFLGIQGRSSSLTTSGTSVPLNNNGPIQRGAYMGTLNNSTYSSGGVASSSTYTRSFFSFRVDSPQRFNATLSGLSADADLYLIRDFNNNGIWDNGRIAGVEDETLRLSTRSGTANETISVDRLLPGTYHLVVQYASLTGSTFFNLQANTSSVNNAILRLDIDELRALTRGDNYPGFLAPDIYGDINIGGINHRFGTFQDREVLQNLQFSSFVNINQRFLDINFSIMDEDNGLDGYIEISDFAQTLTFDTLKGTFKFDGRTGREGASFTSRYTGDGYISVSPIVSLTLPDTIPAEIKFRVNYETF